ncbi:MAG: glycoside hydrolase family 9 protein, partial [Acutalibacteraceae bacterium]
MKKTKKLIALLLSLVLMASVLTLGSVVSARKYGDLNNDGNVNLLDLIVMRKYLAKWSVEVDKVVADVNQDGNVNLLDLIMMRKVLVHILPDFEEIPDNTDYGEVPADYPTETITNFAINQIGYTPDSTKVARITVPERKLSYKCYVVNKKTGKVVYSGDSKSSSQVDSLVQIYMSQFDFSAVKEVGEYYIASPLGRSTTITISKQPYNELQDKLTTALYYQRCGEPLLASIVGETFAHDGCHSSLMPNANQNAKAYILSKYSDATDSEDPTYHKYMIDESKTGLANDFSGGLHDAGDYGRYTVPANGVVAGLIYMTEMFPTGCTTNVITDNKGENIPDTLDEARYEMKWLLKMQNKDDGSVYFRIATKRFADYVMPQQDTLYNSGLYISRTFRKTTAGLAGNAAACYTAFKNIDPEFANQCLKAAKLAYDYVEKNETDGYFEADFGGNVTEYNGAGAGEYGSSDYGGEYYYAAAALFRATGESKYNDKFKEIYAKRVTNASTPMGIYQINGYSANGGGTLAYMLNPNGDKTIKASILESLKGTSDYLNNKTRRNNYGCPTDYANLYWGSNNSIVNAASACAMYNYFSGTSTYDVVVRRINDYILGCNASTYSFV